MISVVPAAVISKLLRDAYLFLTTLTVEQIKIINKLCLLIAVSGRRLDGVTTHSTVGTVG